MSEPARRGSTDAPFTGDNLRKCTKCLQWKDQAAFGRAPDRASNRQSHCRACGSMSHPDRKAKAAARRAAQLVLVDQFKIQQGCKRCGYREKPQALVLTGFPTTGKITSLNRLLAYRMADEKALTHLKQCTVMCLNCAA